MAFSLFFQFYFIIFLYYLINYLNLTKNHKIKNLVNKNYFEKKMSYKKI